MKIKFLILCASLGLFSACQVISPIFVDYYGVRMDVAKWINQQQLLSMQQKRSLVQLSKAQQKLYRIENMTESEKLAIAKENLIAMHCAHLHLTDRKIEQLQQKVFGEDKQRILEIYQQFPKLKLDANSIQCE